MTRIIAGEWRGRRIAVPRSGTRPTTDRVREAMFSSLTSLLVREDTSWEQSAVVDLYSGSGALGLEAASRGAADVVLVESARGAIEVIRENVAALKAPNVSVAAQDVQAWAKSSTYAPRNLILADPPYTVTDTDLVELWEVAVRHHVIAPNALIAIERPASSQDPLGRLWDLVDQRRYGDTHVWYGQHHEIAGVPRLI
jgi:16S rRNA (guanine966-N2)-methyltransferase